VSLEHSSPSLALASSRAAKWRFKLKFSAIKAAQLALLIRLPALWIWMSCPDNFLIQLEQLAVICNSRNVAIVRDVKRIGVISFLCDDDDDQL